jgi:glucose/mannose-6-phosphate isomerase
MGGSHLAGDLIKAVYPHLDVVIHNDYALPRVEDEASSTTLVIASSYSGNTEETLDAFHVAQEKKIPVCALSVGGRLIEEAKKINAPYIQIPDTGIQPRSAVGFSAVGMLTLMNQKNAIQELHALSKTLLSQEYEEAGARLAEKLINRIPVVYSSRANGALAQNWKIRFNENAKTPSFWNVFPELNHNEMISFGDRGNHSLSEFFSFLYIIDDNDHKSVQKRMKVEQKLYKERDLELHNLSLNGVSRWERLFSSLLLADWTSYHLALLYGIEPEKVDLIEKFKNQLDS